MTTQLKCEHCKEMFEISNAIADAMTRWREKSGEPITCGECAGVEEIHEADSEKEIDNENTPATEMPIPRSCLVSTKDL